MIYFVIGPPCSGKSTFIKKTFPNAIIIDLFEYQQKQKAIRFEAVKKSYKEVEKALIKAINENNNKAENDKKQIVLEHTLLKAIRRVDYINAVKNNANEELCCYYMKPNKTTHKQLAQKRNVTYHQDWWDIFEKPTTKEGFDVVYRINPEK